MVHGGNFGPIGNCEQSSISTVIGGQISPHIIDLNFFGNITTFISEDEIYTSQSTKNRTTAVTETTAATTNMSKAPPSIEPLSVSPSKLHTISTLRDSSQFRSAVYAVSNCKLWRYSTIKGQNCSARQLTIIAKEDNR